MRPCDRCGKPVENIQAFCEKCNAHFQRFAQEPPLTDKLETLTESLPPHDWSMDVVFLVACGSAAVGGALIGWLQYGTVGSAFGAFFGVVLAAVLSRMMVV